MHIIDLAAIPCQSFSVILAKKRFHFCIKQIYSAMVATISCDGVTLIENSRILAGEPIIPYPRLENGNFLLLTKAEALPNWREFSTSQKLIYCDALELARLRVQKGPIS